MRNNQGRSLVTIMIIISLCALFLRVVVEQAIKINIAQNESNASQTLKLISAALENYAKDHSGAFPTSLSVLMQTNPAYLDKDYIAQSPIKGYNYACIKLDTLGYSYSAAPIKCNLSGKMTYSISTGGLFVSEECSKKE